MILINDREIGADAEFGLFPYGPPAKQAARYAGMPKPTSCV